MQNFFCGRFFAGGFRFGVGYRRGKRRGNRSCRFGLQKVTILPRSNLVFFLFLIRMFSGVPFGVLFPVEGWASKEITVVYVENLGVEICLKLRVCQVALKGCPASVFPTRWLFYLCIKLTNGRSSCFRWTISVRKYRVTGPTGNFFSGNYFLSKIISREVFFGSENEQDSALVKGVDLD